MEEQEPVEKARDSMAVLAARLPLPLCGPLFIRTQPHHRRLQRSSNRGTFIGIVSLTQEIWLLHALRQLIPDSKSACALGIIRERDSPRPSPRLGTQAAGRLIAHI
jgi:hypothetical protein